MIALTNLGTQWDAYLKPQKFAIWYSRLIESGGNWRLAGPLQNLIKDTNLEAPTRAYDHLENSAGSYDISNHGIIFAAEEKDVRDPLTTGLSEVYYVQLESFSEASPRGPVKIETQSHLPKGSRANVRFSPDGSMFAFLDFPYGDVMNTRIFLGHLGQEYAIDVFDMVTGSEWNLRPWGFEFSPNGHYLTVSAENYGRTSLFRLDLQPHAQPKLLCRGGVVQAGYPLGEKNSGELLVTSNSFVESSLFEIVDANGVKDPRVVSSQSKHGAKFGLSEKQVSEIYSEGAGDYIVQSWVIKPRNLDPNKKYPLALLPHGGPQDASRDEWGWRVSIPVQVDPRFR